MADTPEEIEDEEVQPSDDNQNLMCFLNDVRECGPSCMAFKDQVSESPYLDVQQKNCTLLVAVERVGRYSGGLFKLLKDFKDDAARAKTSTKPPTTPAGG